MICVLRDHPPLSIHQFSTMHDYSKQKTVEQKRLEDIIEIIEVEYDSITIF